MKLYELHHFSDASTVGYGQCSYLRMKDEHDLISTCLVMSKSKVTPKRSTTIPRLELMAAALSVPSVPISLKSILVTSKVMLGGACSWYLGLYVSVVPNRLLGVEGRLIPCPAACVVILMMSDEVGFIGIPRPLGNPLFWLSSILMLLGILPRFLM